MNVVPAIICVSNQWPTDAFWHSVRMAGRLVEAELTLVKPDPDEIQQMILRSWLDYAHPAGTA